MPDAIQEFEQAVGKLTNWSELRRQAKRDPGLLMGMIELFLAYRVKTFRTLKTVSITFKTEIEAEEFHKLILQTQRIQRDITSDDSPQVRAGVVP